MWNVDFEERQSYQMVGGFDNDVMYKYMLFNMICENS